MMQTAIARQPHLDNSHQGAKKSSFQPGKPVKQTQQRTPCPCGGGCPSCAGLPLQAKLKIGAPDDRYEREADRIADQIISAPRRQPCGHGTRMQMPQEKYFNAPSPGGQIMRQCSSCQKKKEDKTIQLKPKAHTAKMRNTSLRQAIRLKPANTPGQIKTSAGIAPEIASLQSGGWSPSGMNAMLRINGGRPLSQNERSFYEPRFGTNFSHVRIHESTQANQMARAINARAFTLGNNIVMGAGEYSPHSSAGQRLLAHELVHVGQQEKGEIRRNTIQRKYSCRFPTYPGMGGIARTSGGYWYPHDFAGPIDVNDVHGAPSSTGYHVPNSASTLYNCMRWAVGEGVPSTREWWQGVARTAAVPWPEEDFLRGKSCNQITATGKSDHKVKLYEYLHRDQFHIVRQEDDGKWSSKTGTGYLYRGINDPDAHTASHYVPMSQMRSTYWSCP